jgi:EAL domain-containing protein (putative c-di-GMP-specific phosphodiesterase class I)/AmiR/NasT family two-component response regulator
MHALPVPDPSRLNRQTARSPAMRQVEALPPVDSVLVVDDSAVQREHAVVLCRALGVQSIYEAGDGHEALALLTMLVLPPSIMVVDLEMPGLDGVELLEQLRRRGIEIPIILASSRERAIIDTVQILGEDLGLRVVASLSKPLTATALRRAFSRYQKVNAPRSATRQSRFPIETDALIAAIDARQIEVHYQPKVDIRTGIVRGVEALARWSIPAMGSIPPEQFITLAERDGLIGPLTTCVVEQAFEQAAQWKEHGVQMSMAVNLSPRLLGRSEIVQEIADLADEHGLVPNHVMLEITEGSLVANLGPALSVLARLRLKGFGLSIDDFGTGFSSMQQLARIPFSELKIDRSFVHGAHRRKILRVILASALDMARQLELASVAEGVEDLEDWLLLQELGCTMGQGWLIAKAMPANELIPWMKANRTRLDGLRSSAPA